MLIMEIKTLKNHIYSMQNTKLEIYANECLFYIFPPFKKIKFIIIDLQNHIALYYLHLFNFFVFVFCVSRSQLSVD